MAVPPSTQPSHQHPTATTAAPTTVAAPDRRLHDVTGPEESRRRDARGPGRSRCGPNAQQAVTRQHSRSRPLISRVGPIDPPERGRSRPRRTTARSSRRLRVSRRPSRSLGPADALRCVRIFMLNLVRELPAPLRLDHVLASHGGRSSNLRSRPTWLAPPAGGPPLPQRPEHVVSMAAAATTSRHPAVRFPASAGAGPPAHRRLVPQLVVLLVDTHRAHLHVTLTRPWMSTLRMPALRAEQHSPSSSCRLASGWADHPSRASHCCFRRA